MGNIGNAMVAVGPASCLFWVAWDVVGHKILLNLFLAILINNFQDQEVLAAASLLLDLCCALLCRAVLCCAVLRRSASSSSFAAG